MNKDTLKGQWQQIKGKVKQKWGKLTDDELTRIDGSLDQLKGTLQEKYGYDRDKIEDEIQTFSKDNKLD